MTPEIQKILEEHFESDKKQFAKLEELATINGGHLSYFNKNLEEVKTMLQEQNRINLEQQKTLTEHISRVEPMLSAYEEDTKFWKTLGFKAKKWSVGIGIVGSVIGSLYVIKAFIINSIK